MSWLWPDLRVLAVTDELFGKLEPVRPEMAVRLLKHFAAVASAPLTVDMLTELIRVLWQVIGPGQRVLLACPRDLGTDVARLIVPAVGKLPPPSPLPTA